VARFNSYPRISTSAGSFIPEASRRIIFRDSGRTRFSASATRVGADPNGRRNSARIFCRSTNRIPSSLDVSPTTPYRAGYPALMKVSEVLRLLQEDGWNLVATRGSHRQFKHESKPGRVTVPGKPSDDLAPGTLNSIFKQAGLKK